MKKETYNFEIKDLLTQFVAAFDDTVIKRYNKDRIERSKIQVRYVFAPKQRVMYDVVNKAQNITLPVVTIDLQSVSYDSSRAFNKASNLYNYSNEIDNTSIEMPTPINLEVSMSILGKYMQDVEQIITNFAPFTNPYIIITWREPSEVAKDVEIRTEVLWNENISLNSPTETTYSDKFRIVADTSFTIKGWLFRSRNTESKPIYFIENNFITSDKNWTINQPLTTLEYENFFNTYIKNGDCFDNLVIDPMGYSVNVESCIGYAGKLSSRMDTFTLSATPQIDNIYLTNGGTTIEATSFSPIKLNKQGSALDLHNFTLLGDNFLKTTEVLLSSDNNSLTQGLTTFDTKYTGPVTGFLLPKENYTVMSNNTMSVNIPHLDGSGKVDIIVKNPAGWTSTSSISGFYMVAE